MGKVVTESRVTPGYRDLVTLYDTGTGAGNYEYYPNQRYFNAGGSTMSQPTQTTTGFRSGSSELDGFIDTTTPTTLAERAHLLDEDKLEKKRQRAMDTGHPFTTVKNEYLTPTIVGTSTFAYGRTWRYEGVLMPSARYTVLGLPDSFPYLEPFPASYFGPKAIRDTVPTSPVAGLLNALVELKRDGLPSMPGASTMNRGGLSPASVGDEYLNYEFGFKPLASDIAKTMYAVSEASRLIQQRERDSGRIVRRQRGLEQNVVLSTQTNTVPHLNSRGTSIANRSPYGESGSWPFLFAESSQRVTETVTTTRSSWFSGAYTYFFQEAGASVGLGGKVADFERRANALLGTRLTPEVIWEATPWSWLLDWYVNIGDNIANANSLSQDGLVIRWAYLMHTVTRTHTLTAEGAIFNDGSTVPPCSVTWRTTTKDRQQASPFGFGSDPNSFTNRQWSILAALGMTRSDKTLRTAR